MKNKEISFANEDGLFRLRAVEMVQNGEPKYAVAKKLGVHQSTIRAWCKMYEQGGVERLNTYRKPRPSYNLDLVELESMYSSCPEKYKERLWRLIRLAKGESLTTISADSGISKQAIMRDRRDYEAGKLPPVIII